jgi:hypothetical protein
MPSMRTDMSSLLPKALATGLALLLLSAPQSLPSGDVSTIPQLLMNGGVAAILVYIWWRTHSQANEQQQELRKVIGEAFQATRKNSREVARKNQQRHAQRQDRMMKMMEERIEMDRQLTGTLNRLEAKLDQIDE